MEPLTDHIGHAGGVERSARGVTLIEMLFVIGIIAIIVVAALAIFNTVRASQDRSTALQQVSSIRSAIATWAGDKPLDFGETGGLQRVEQLQPWLPGRLSGNPDAQSTTTMLDLGSANPWDGTYEIGPSAGTTGTNHPYRFNLAVRKVPASEAEALCRQLEDGAAINADGAKLIQLTADTQVADPVPSTSTDAGTDPAPACASGDSTGAQVILITYRV